MEFHWKTSYSPAHSLDLDKLEPCHKAPEGAQGNKRSLGDGRLWKFNFFDWEDNLPTYQSPISVLDLVPRTTTSNSLTSEEKRRNATSCARIANTWAIDPGHGLDMARGKGIQKAEQRDGQRSWWSVRQNQLTCVHLQMHWARSMPLIKDNLILASLTFRFSGWRWHIVLIVDTGFACFCVTQDVFKHFDKNGDQLLSAPEMLSFVTCRCGSIVQSEVSGPARKMLRLWNNCGSGKPSVISNHQSLAWDDWNLESRPRRALWDLTVAMMNGWRSVDFGFISLGFSAYKTNLFVDVSGIGQARLVSMFGSTRFLNPVLAKDTNTSETNLLGNRSQSKRTRSYMRRTLALRKTDRKEDRQKDRET